MPQNNLPPELVAALIANLGHAQPPKERKKTSFSKKLVIINGLWAAFMTVAALVYAWFAKDTSIFSYMFPSVYGEFTVCAAAYVMKAMKENTEGGLTYDMAMRDTTTTDFVPPPDPAPPPKAKPKTKPKKAEESEESA